MAIQELALKGGKFSTSSSIVDKNDALTYSGPCTITRGYSIVTKNGSYYNAHTSDLFKKGERLGWEPSTLGLKSTWFFSLVPAPPHPQH